MADSKKGSTKMPSGRVKNVRPSKLTTGKGGKSTKKGC